MPRIAIERNLQRQRAVLQTRSNSNRKVSVPAPIGGWNTRDSLGSMPTTDAFQLDNWEPDVGAVKLVPGYTLFATQLGNGGGAIMEFNDRYGSAMVAADNQGVLYVKQAGQALVELEDPRDFTSIGNPSSGNGRYSWVMFRDRLILVNGVYAPTHVYRSSASAQYPDSTEIYYPGGSLPFSGSGLNVFRLTGVFAYKNRLFFWERDSQDFWYLGVDEYQGTLTKFPLSSVANSGGSLVAMTSWNLDGGDGIDDYAVFIFSSGEVLVYQGTDPGLSSAWALVGRYQIGHPVGRDAITQFAGKVLVATSFDYVTLPDVFLTKGFQQPTKLSGAAKTSVEQHATKDGWRAVYVPKRGWLLVNVPQGAGTYHQHIVNLRTGAPFRITEWDADAIGVFNDDLYISVGAGIYKIDGKSRNGSNINAIAKQAFSDLNFADNKKVARYRAMMNAEGTVTVNSGLMFDFENSPKVTQSVDYSWSNAGAADWGSEWGADWSNDGQERFEWQMGTGKGASIAPQISVSTKNQDVNWFRTDYLIKRLGNLL